jgi:hypothetical protein
MSKCRLSVFFALCAIALFGCGGVQGSYVFGGDGLNITIELRSGDVAVVTLPGLGETEGTYSVDGDAVTITIEGDPETFTIEDGNLVGSGFGENMVFGKQ